MKKKILYFIAALIILSIKVQNSIAQTVVNQQNNEEELMEEDMGGDDDDSTMVNFSFFADSLHWNMLPDSVKRQWSNEVIHNRKYDFTAKPDTTPIVLQDYVHRCYVHPYCNYVTSDFGFRRRGFHNGIDIKLQTGDPVHAAFDGIVRITKRTKGYGNVVVINHLNGLETIYGHLSKIEVTANQFVKAGDIIGKGGNTGRSTGSHLHFEIRYYGEPIDPKDVIDFKNYCLHSDTLYLSKKQFEYIVELRKVKYHTIRKGDTLSGIAVRYGTTVRHLCALNNITPKTVLRIGRQIRYN